MKYKGKKVAGRNTEILVLPRGDEKIVFKARAVDSSEVFDKLVTMPEPPKRMKPGGIQEINTTDPDYLKKLQEYGELKTHFYAIFSLRATEELEWERVDFDKPETWKFWTEELKESFTDIEIRHITQLIMTVNALDENMLNQAREDFLQEEAQAVK